MSPLGLRGSAVVNARHKRRLERQLASLTGRSPRLRSLVTDLQGRPGIVLRLPLGILLVVGGLLAILLVFGPWMAPLGRLLPAIDAVELGPAVKPGILALSESWMIWRRKFRTNDEH